MANHDRYETNILKALQRIAGSLESIDRTLKNKNSTKEKVDINTVKQNNKEE